MSHIYENPDLTFSQVKDIFIKASQGELKGTEKTDGQNMYVSYSLVEKKAKAKLESTSLAVSMQSFGQQNGQSIHQKL